MDTLRASIALLSVCGLGPRRFWSLVARFAAPQGLLCASLSALRAAGVSESVARAIVSLEADQVADDVLERAYSCGAQAIALSNQSYPAALRFTFDPPPVLYIRGEFAPSDVEAVAIVGSRRASRYGLDAGSLIAGDLARAGVTVVSGLARGIDAAAHRAALAAGGRTVAVLGSGIDWIYPAQNRGLASDIIGSGAIVSEFPPGTRPDAGNFPRRNRIISGLSLAVVVVEAGARSGSLITARLAAEQGREVCAVPGAIRVPQTRGTHRLLRDGAALVENGEEVLAAAMPWRLVSQSPPSTENSPLVALLTASDTRCQIDDLAEQTGSSVEDLLKELLDLELRGLVVRHPGMSFSSAR